MITETDSVSKALEQAGELWPDLKTDRAALLRRILEEGVASISNRVDRDKAVRLNAIESLSGSMTGVWPKNWRAELDSEWPA